MKHNLNVQLCTEEQLDDFADYETEKKPESDISTDYSVLGYTPTPVDYIRRCRTVDEAFEILDYLKKRDEISANDYKKLVRKLKSEGLNGFGTIKDTGFYGSIFSK